MNSSGVDEEIEFTWRIENYDFLLHPHITDYSYKKFRSPLFSAGKPRHSVWYLNICASISDMGTYLLSHQAVRLRGSFYGHFNLKVSLVGLKSEVKNIPHFYPRDGSGLSTDKDLLSQEALTLRCTFTYSNPPHQYTNDLTELKQNISRLFLSGEFSDLTLYTGDKEFFVHKFLLQKRAPKLLEDLEQVSENCEVERVKVDNISTPVLQTLLQYIYSGKLDAISEESLPELYKIVEKYELEEFNVINLKKFASITSQIRVIRRIICWQTLANDVLSDKIILFEQINFECARFLVKVSMKITVQETRMHASFQCLGSLDEDILMSCITSSGLDKNNLKHEKMQMLLFSARNCKKEHNLQQKFDYSSKDIESGLHLQLNLAISKGRHFHSVDGMTPINPEHLSIFGMGVLRQDLIKLADATFLDQNSGDVNLCFDHDTFRAHKAVLVVWSPVFSSMFHHDMKEKINNEVNISDLDIGTGLRLLEFMYSGEMDKEDYEEDAKLYAAADKYQVFSLFGKCSSFLASHLTLDNACDMMVLAYQHSDDNLLTTVQKYIATNPHDILDSSKWLFLLDTHPRLASKILHYITCDLRPLICTK